MLRLPRQGRRGQNLVLSAGIVVLGIFVTFGLSRFMAEEESSNEEALESVYLTQENTAMGGASQSRRPGVESGSPSIETVEAGVESFSTTHRCFSFHSGSRLFGSNALSAKESEPGAIHGEMRDFISSDLIEIRLLGTAEGDFVYHRQFGWMKYSDGEWRAMDPFELPEFLKESYPQLCRYELATGGGGGDASFHRSLWMADPQDIE